VTSAADPRADSDALLVVHEAGEPAGLVPGSLAELLAPDGDQPGGSTCQGNRLPLTRHGARGSAAWLPDQPDAGDAVPVGTIADLAVVISHYYVDTTPRAGLVGGRLMCAGVGRGGQPETPQPLVQGVETLRVLYGLDRDGDGAVEGWSRAGALTMADWALVRAVRVCLTLRGEVRGAAAVGPAPRAPGCPGEAATAAAGAAEHAGGLVRRALVTTVVLRNRAVGG